MSEDHGRDFRKMANLRKAPALGRPGTPDRAASAACFRVSDGAHLITGTVLPRNGGHSGGKT
ncbi:hypothetical protein [Antarctobacter sp.]|uniref:hypothetical protein n=1 Tax=Antarctobacter sp. TaxID=1872577 RepID=UPI003A94E8C8